MVIEEELSEFARSKLSLYMGIFLAALSVAFIIQTDNFLVTVIACAVAVSPQSA
jgi:cell division protein FtsL